MSDRRTFLKSAMAGTLLVGLDNIAKASEGKPAAEQWISSLTWTVATAAPIGRFPLAYQHANKKIKLDSPNPSNRFSLIGRKKILRISPTSEKEQIGSHLTIGSLLKKSAYRKKAGQFSLPDAACIVLTRLAAKSVLSAPSTVPGKERFRLTQPFVLAEQNAGMSVPGAFRSVKQVLEST